MSRAARPALEAVTFGCRLNAHETEAALARARADGLEAGVVVNTCAVTEEAVRQARQAIRRARRERPGVPIIATGCAAQIRPDAFAAMPEVDLVLGNGLKAAPGAYGAESFAARVRLGPIGAEAAPAARGLRLPQAGRARASLEVQNGCDHRCTFCIIPFGRGASRSTPPGEAAERAAALVEEGVREVVLTGVDLTDYRSERDGRAVRLGDLVFEILARAPDLARLRLSSVDAAEVDERLMEAFAGEPRLAPYLHLSLQSGSDMILKRMKRRHLRADALDLVRRVRAVRPETAFGADLIAGFPTETEAMFQESLDLIEEAGLAFVHVFPFSPRPGTPAARMPQLPPALVRERAGRMREAAAAALSRHLAAQRGRDLEVLVEGPGRGRAADFTEILLPSGLAAGEFVRARGGGSPDGRRLEVELARPQAGSRPRPGSETPRV